MSYEQETTDLRARIRELEAELATRMAENRSMWEALGKPLAVEPDLQTRVEHAEARAEKAEGQVKRSEYVASRYESESKQFEELWQAERAKSVALKARAEKVRELEAEVLLAHEQKQVIRELEAELDAEWRRRTQMEERAVDAEARVAFLEKDWENRHAARVREIVALEARVAELEQGVQTALRGIRLSDGPKGGHSALAGEVAESILKPLLIEAREREAESISARSPEPERRGEARSI